jgi:hypothetical protein
MTVLDAFFHFQCSFPYIFKTENKLESGRNQVTYTYFTLGTYVSSDEVAYYAKSDLGENRPRIQ